MRSSSVNTVILEVLEQNHSHLTANEVYEHIRGRLPAVNPSTVYRALERLSDSGKISVSDMGTGSAVYEALINGMHHHLVCQVCGRVYTLEHQAVQEFFKSIEASNQFQVSTNHLILFGVCSNCQGKVNSQMGEKSLPKDLSHHLH
jgi:Fur family transcriptional regulator, ferric uptake regulator